MMRLFIDSVQAVATVLVIWPWVLKEICRLQIESWRARAAQWRRKLRYRKEIK